MLAPLLGTQCPFGCFPRSKEFWFLETYGHLILKFFPMASCCSMCLVPHQAASLSGKLAQFVRKPTLLLWGVCLPQAFIKRIWVVMRTPFLRSPSSSCSFVMPKLTCPLPVSIIKPDLWFTKPPLHSGVNVEPPRGVVSSHRHGDAPRPWKTTRLTPAPSIPPFVVPPPSPQLCTGSWTDSLYREATAQEQGTQFQSRSEGKSGVGILELGGCRTWTSLPVASFMFLSSPGPLMSQIFLKGKKIHQRSQHKQALGVE